MNSAEKEAVLHCLKVTIDEALCEDCPLYGTTGTYLCEKDCARLAINALEQEPCTDAISREKALQIIRAWFDREATPSDLKNEIEQLPPVTPQYTDAEIQKMQDLEFAEIQKAYEIGKAENIDVLDKIREEFISLYPKNYAGGLELGGVSCVFSLYKVLSIIDKYKTSPTGKEGSE